MIKVKPFADTIRDLRKQLNLSQEQLAARLNVSYQTVNRWESGKVEPQKNQREAVQKLIEENYGDKSDPELFPESTAVVPRRRRGVSKSPILGNRGMEQMLWDAACSVRGEKDAPKFKDYLLPLLFLKRLSDVFDDEIDRLAEEYGDRSTALEIAETDHSLLRFYLPPEARWAAISGRTELEWPPDESPKDIGEHLTKAVRV